MRKGATRANETFAQHYDRLGVPGEIDDRPVEVALEEELRRQILKGERGRRLQNISVKLDPVQIQAPRKIATMKSIPYQTLIRQWLADAIRREFHFTGR
jgi:predicted DNA binding CopG/RHH family protein